MKIFIVHGWTYNLDKWRPLREEFKKFSLEPVFLKVPGLTAPSKKPWTIQDYIDWLHQHLKNEKHPIVVGHSNGGRIALNYLQKYPHGIGKLVLIASAGIPHRRLKTRLKLGFMKAAAKAGKPLKFIPGARKVSYRLIGGLDYYQAPPNMRITMKNMLAANKTIDLNKIDIPVVIIWGSDDKITPLLDGQLMHRKIKNSQLHVIDGADHRPYFTYPQQVAKLINDAATAKK